MTDASARPALTELRAANAVRRAIAKLRLATPETIDALEGEMFESMGQHLDNLGSQHEKLQNEAEQALEKARARAAGIQEQRARDELAEERPLALMEEIKAFIRQLQAGLGELRSKCRVISSRPVSAEEAQELENLVEIGAARVKDFATECVKRANELKKIKLPDSMKTGWTAIASEIVEAKRQGEIAVSGARLALKNAQDARRKAVLETRMADLKRTVEEASAAVPAAEQFIISAENVVEPFVTGKRKEESVLLPLCDEATQAVEMARRQIDIVREDLQAARLSVVVAEDNAQLKKDAEAFLASEFKRPTIRLGQLDRRVQRVVNIVSRYKRERRAVRNKALYATLREELIAKAKGKAESQAFEKALPALTAAEKEVEPFGGHRQMSIQAMRAMAEQVQRAIDRARAALDAAAYEVCPIDDSLDDELKRKLKEAVRPHIKRPYIRQGQLERRMARLVNLLGSFRKSIDKRGATEVAKVRDCVLSLVQRQVSAMGGDAGGLFDELTGGSLVLEESAFVTFVETAHKTRDAEPMELPEVAVLKRFYASLLRPGAPGLSKADFLQIGQKRLRVVKPTTLTTNFAISTSKIMRALRAGEVLETLEGPQREPKAGVMRLRVRAVKDGKEGWASLTSNTGTEFLVEV